MWDVQGLFFGEEESGHFDILHVEEFNYGVGGFCACLVSKVSELWA